MDYRLIDPHVAVGVKETQGRSAPGHPLLGQSLAELSGPSGRGQAGQFAPERFDFRCPVQSQHAPQVLGRILLKALRTFDAPERHEQERQQTGAQSIKGRTKLAVDFLRAIEKPAGDQDGQRQENSGARDGGSRTKERRRILQQPQARQQSVGAAIRRVGILAGQGLFRGGGATIGHFWVRALCRGERWRGEGGERRTGQFWVRTSCGAKRQLGLSRRGRFPSQTAQEFPNGILADTDPPRDLALTAPVGFEPLDQLLSRLC